MKLFVEAPNRKKIELCLLKEGCDIGMEEAPKETLGW